MILIAESGCSVVKLHDHLGNAGLVYHLETLGLCPTINQQQLENFAVDVADNNLIKFNRYKDLEGQFDDKTDAQVAYISYFLRKKTRGIDKKYYIIT